MKTKSKIAFALPQSLKSEILECVVKEGYGLRGKSKWIYESIESLLLIKDYPKLINYNDEMHGFNDIEFIVIDHKLKLEIDNAVLQVRTKYPMLEGVKSRILRTAVMQRILRS